MTLRTARSILASLLVLAAGTGCNGDDSTHSMPQSSSATHFLEPCGTECPAGLECICGTCSRACTSSSVCEDISAQATCASVPTAHPDCNAIVVGHACDVACTTDADCNGVPAAKHCARGFCRATASGTGPDSGSGGGSGDSGGGSGASAGGASSGGAGASSGSSSASSGGSGASAGGSGPPDAGAGGATSTDSGSGGTTASGGTASAGASSGGSAGASGGAGGTPAGAPVVSGTRLKAHYTTAGDGARVYRRGVLYDSTLSVDCKYGLAADGSLRCLPLQGADAQYSDVYYSDDKCTAPYALLTTAPQGCAPALPKFALAQGTAKDACDSTPVVHVYPVEGTVVSPSITYQNHGTACVSVGVGVPGTIKVRLKAELPATSFVEGTKKAER